MDKVKDYLAIACLAYERGDPDFAVRAFLSGMDAAASTGDLKQVVDFLRAPVAQLVTNVPAAENTMAPALHSDDAATSPVPETVSNEPAEETVKGTPLPLEQTQVDGVKSPAIETPVDPQPVVAPIPEPIPSTITSLSASMIDDGDEELEARAEAEDEIDDDEDLDDEDDEEDDESDDEDEEEDDGMQLSISTSTPLRLKQG